MAACLQSGAGLTCGNEEGLLHVPAALNGQHLFRVGGIQDTQGAGAAHGGYQCLRTQRRATHAQKHHLLKVRALPNQSSDARKAELHAAGKVEPAQKLRNALRLLLPQRVVAGPKAVLYLVSIKLPERRLKDGSKRIEPIGKERGMGGFSHGCTIRTSRASCQTPKSAPLATTTARWQTQARCTRETVPAANRGQMRSRSRLARPIKRGNNHSLLLAGGVRGASYSLPLDGGELERG